MGVMQVGVCVIYAAADMADTPSTEIYGRFMFA
jgi:hypothetical protein